jgi:hypothetical protein
VFAHPHTGGPLPKANVTRRMRAALEAAKLDTEHCSTICGHVRDADGRGGRPDADVAGVDGGIATWRRRRSLRITRRATARLKWWQPRSHGKRLSIDARS